MEYTSRLRGWAIDRALELAKLGEGGACSAAELIASAGELAAWCHDPQEACEAMQASIVDHYAEAAAGAGAKLVDFIAALQRISDARLADGMDKGAGA